jgi:predicted phosphohydrolase
MIIQYASDLHYEFLRNRQFLSKQPLRPVGDVLILAGDIIPLNQIEKHTDFISYLSDHWSTVLWIPGNHEFYHSDFATYDAPFNINLKQNVQLVSEQSIIIDNIEFICATLWSFISKEHAPIIRKSLSDFHAISYDADVLTVEQFNKTHERHRNFIKKQLQKRSKETLSQVVVSHHVPTLQHYPLEYKNSLINDAFVSNQEHLFIEERPDYWIYGHHHRNTASFKINRTQLLTNQLGYVHHKEHHLFKTSCTITV